MEGMLFDQKKKRINIDNLTGKGGETGREDRSGLTLEVRSGRASIFLGEPGRDPGGRSYEAI